MLILTDRENHATGGGHINARNVEAIKSICPDALIVETGVDEEMRSGALRKVVERARGVFGGLSDRLIEALLERVEQEKPRTIWFNQSLTGAAVRAVKRRFPQVKTYVYFHNCEAEFYKARVGTEGGWRSRLYYLIARRAEGLSVRWSDVLVTLNRRDSEALRKNYGRPADYICPTTFDDRGAVAYEPSAGELRLLFVGSDFFANVEGVGWFVERVMPSLGETRLSVVGKGLERYRSRWAAGNVEVVGTVESLREWYGKADLVVSPIFSGSGMKTKTAEALMYGVPVVATTEAFEGYEIDHIEVGALCNTSEEFIEKLRLFAAHKELLPSLARGARRCYEENYSQEVAIEIFRKILTDNEK